MSFLKKILLLTPLSFLLIIEGNSQVIYPRSSDQFDKVKDRITTAEGDSIFLYFFDEAYNFQQVDDDSLFLDMKNNIVDFISRYRRDTLEDIEPSKREFVKTIFNKIQSVNEFIKKENENVEEFYKDWPKRYIRIKEEKTKELEDLINALPNSKEKVWLLLQYLNIGFPLELNNIIRSNCFKAQDCAETILDSFERGMAYMYVGDFAGEYNIKDIAISTYYLAKECFYNSSRSDSTKYYQQGIIDEKIARVIAYMGIAQSGIKTSNYYLTAAEYFRKAGNIDNYNKNFSSFLDIRSSLLPYLDYFYNDTMVYFQSEQNILKSLETWYHDFRNKKNGADKTSYINFSSIGTILRDYESNEESLPYFLYALQAAVNDKNFWGIYNNLGEVADTYSLLGNEKLAIAYADLAISLGDIVAEMGKYFYYYALIRKGYYYNVLKKYDSSLYYLNKIIFHAIPRTMVEIESSYTSTPPIIYESEPFSEIHEWALLIKQNIFSILKSDSVWQYSFVHDRLRVRHLREFSQLLQIETEAVTSWLDREFTTAKKQKEKVEVLNKKISKQNGWLISGLVILIISLLGLVVFIIRYRKQSRKLKRNLNEHIAFKNLTTHDIKELVNNLPLIWKGVENKEPVTPTIGNAIAHTKLISKYLKMIFELNVDNVSPVSRQIELAKIYSETFKRTRLTDNYIINIINNIKDEYVLQELPVPTLLLNNFIKNSIEHGFEDEKQTELDIIINCLNTPTGFSLMIEDNGCGLYYSKRRNLTTGKGIQFAKETINVFNSYNRQYKINFSDDSVFDKQTKNMGRGTVVVIEFVKR